MDGSRQESKRLSLQLEGDNRKYAKSLSDWQDRARELEVDLGTLQAEKAGLAKDLQAAHDVTNALQAKLDERGKDMLAVLNELRDRLPPSPTGDVPQPRAKIRKTRS